MKTRCTNCEKDISNANYDRHLKSCLSGGPKNKQPKYKDLGVTKITDEYAKCPYCERSVHIDAITHHINRSHLKVKNKNYFIPKPGKMCGWTDEIKNSAIKKSKLTKKHKSLSGQYDNGWTGKKQTESSNIKRSEKQSIIIAERGSSPNRIFKKGKYNGVWFDSSWELAFYLYKKQIENLDIKRNKKRLKYLFGDKERITIPDFEIDGVLYEIKGKMNWDSSKRDIHKFNQLNNIVKWIFYDDIKHILKWAKAQYGERFWEKFYDK